MDSKVLAQVHPLMLSKGSQAFARSETNAPRPSKKTNFAPASCRPTARGQPSCVDTIPPEVLRASGVFADSNDLPITAERLRDTVKMLHSKTQYAVHQMLESMPVEPFAQIDSGDTVFSNATLRRLFSEVLGRRYRTAPCMGNSEFVVALIGSFLCTVDPSAVPSSSDYIAKVSRALYESGEIEEQAFRGAMQKEVSSFGRFFMIHAR